MDKLIQWLGSDFAPKVAKFMDKKIIKALSSALMANVPILLLGSLISIYNLIAGYLPFLPDLSPVVDDVHDDHSSVNRKFPVPGGLRPLRRDRHDSGVLRGDRDDCYQ